MSKTRRLESRTRQGPPMLGGGFDITATGAPPLAVGLDSFGVIPAPLVIPAKAGIQQHRRTEGKSFLRKQESSRM
ncbi:MAG: hypothetical protein JSV52_13715 [Candidatus Zixiibacteriota bacterium]|nr:MAG: hypothetical protein JSV52_13715 [candidate division Zixibacteria bacterium]